jgi:hypothetical protein
LCVAVGLGVVQVPSEADACGGFFCDNVTPVVQSAERILFRINDDRTITTVVTRFHTYISGFEMTSDPHFLPSATAPDVDNVHELQAYREASAPRPSRHRRNLPLGMLTFVVAPLLLRRRRAG